MSTAIKANILLTPLVLLVVVPCWWSLLLLVIYMAGGRYACKHRQGVRRIFSEYLRTVERMERKMFDNAG